MSLLVKLNSLHCTIDNLHGEMLFGLDEEGMEFSEEITPFAEQEYLLAIHHLEVSLRHLRMSIMHQIDKK